MAAESRMGGLFQLRSIRTSIFLIVGALGALLIGALAYLAVNAEADRSRAVRARADNTIGDHLLSAAGDWAVERGRSNTALGLPTPATPADRTALSDRRAHAEKSFRDALDALAREGEATSEEFRLAQTAVGKLEALRKRVDVALGKPAAEREPGLGPEIVAALTGAIEASQRLRMVNEARVDDAGVRLVELHQLKHFAWVVSEFAGRERAQLGGLIASGKPIAIDRLQALSEFRGRVMLAWDVVEAGLRHPSTSDAIKAAAEVVRAQFFGELQKTRVAVYQASLAGQPYPLTGVEWFERSTRGIDTVLALSKALSTEADTLAAATVTGNQTILVIAGILLLLGLITAGISLWFVARRVTRPLDEITAAMTEMSQGRVDVSVPFVGRRDEIGTMAAALEIFRTGIAERRALRLEQEAAREKAVEERIAEETRRREALLEVFDLLELDLESAVSTIQGHSAGAVRSVERVTQSAEAIGGEVTTVTVAAEQASRNVTTIAAATEQLSASSQEIATQTARSASIAKETAAEAKGAAARIDALRDAADAIGDVVNTIAEVAMKTNLLALNATIEAARAGDAGNGFAVVAGEVKELARQTATATEDIGRRIAQIQAATKASVDAIGQVSQSVHRMDEANAQVANAVEEQESTLRDVARGLAEASAGVTEVASAVARIDTQTQEIGNLAARTQETVATTDDCVTDVRTSLVVSLRSTIHGNRRRHARVPVDMPGVLKVGGKSLNVRLRDLSVGGALVEFPGIELTVTSKAVLELSAIGRLDGEIVGLSENRVNLRFDKMTDEAAGRLEQQIEDIVAADTIFIERAKKGAEQIGQALTDAVRRGEISEADLFKHDYEPIPGTQPQQFMAPYTEVTDRLFPSIQESIANFDSGVVFAAAVDKMGYLPTHNRKFSQPQRQGDVVWNTANSRNRRIFNDGTGLAAARNTRPHIVQSYERDMGGGEKVIMKEVDAPIRVDGRHWGGFRLAYLAKMRSAMKPKSASEEKTAPSVQQRRTGT